MASFSKMGRWPVGYFRAFSSWLLRNRKEVGRRVEVLTAEIERIGFIRILYRTKENADGSRTVTEERIGFSVTPGSSLEGLLQAYIAHGGNPLDISPFWMPDETVVVDQDGEGNPILAPAYPHGGVVYLKSATPDEPRAKKTEDDEGNVIYESTGFEHYPGGDLPVARFYAARVGRRESQGDLNTVTLMRGMRDWANQEIKTRLQDLEWRIIKLMDLREQLTQERDVTLQQAFGKSLEGLPGFDEVQFDPGMTVPSLVQDMYNRIFILDTEGGVQAFRAAEEVAFLDFTFEDELSEYRFPLGC